MSYLGVGIVIVVFAWRMVVGFRKGMIAEVISLISLIVAGVCLAALLMAVGSYLEANIGQALQMLIVLAVVGLVYKLASLIFSSLKLIADLPVIKSLNRILGAVLGAVEATVIILIIIHVLRYFSFSLPALSEQIAGSL